MWPGKGRALGKVGATANLDSSCARRALQYCGSGRRNGIPDRTKKPTKKARKRDRRSESALHNKEPIQGTSGATARPKVPMRRRGTDCLVVVTKRGNAHGAKGAGHRRLRLSQLATGRAPYFNGRRQPSIGGTSRISREAYVRICERLGVQFPGPTRQEQGPEMALAEDDDMVEALSSD